MSMKRQHIMFSHAFFLKHDEKQNQEKFKPYPPLATLYAAAVLREKQHQVSFFDAVLADSIDEFYQDVDALRPDVLVIYEDDFNFLTKMCLSHVREATVSMLQHAKALGVTVIVHSADASDEPDVYLQAGADFVIAGEAEETLSELCDWLNTESPSYACLPDGVICWRDNSLVRTNSRKTMRRVDQLPQPAFDLIDFDRYRTAWKNRHGFYSINMVTTRGCPYKCNWCAKPIWGQQYVSHTPEFIASQLSLLVELAQPDHIWFADDIFGLKKDWVKRFADLVERKQIKTAFTIQSRADLIDKSVSEALALAGCSEVWLGAESGSQQILDAMDKEIQVEDISHARQWLGEQNIRVGFFIQLGYPGEELEQIDETRNMILNLKPDDIGVSVSYPLPGTVFHERVSSQMKGKTHWTESNDLDAVFNTTFHAEFYREIRNHLHHELDALHQGDDGQLWQKRWDALMDKADDYRSLEPIRLDNLL